MKKFFSLMFISFLLSLAGQALAFPYAPVMTYETNGLKLNISWTPVPEATGYSLYYAPYPYTGPESVDSMDMGSARSFSIDLWENAAYYIAIKAYNDSENSGYSNIEQFTVSSNSLGCDGGSEGRSVKFTGILFHDMNGNGIRDDYAGIDEANYTGSGWRDLNSGLEPLIEGAEIQICDQVVTTDTNGAFQLIVPPGSHKIFINLEPFRWFFESNEKMQKLSTGIEYLLAQDTVLDMGIGVGFLTLPYKKSDYGVTKLFSYTDIDPTPSFIGRYNKENDTYATFDNPGGADTHRGIDWGSREPGKEFVAMAPGLVFWVGTAGNGSEMIILIHTDYENVEELHLNTMSKNGIQTFYSELLEVSQDIRVGDWVSRGQVLGIGGNRYSAENCAERICGVHADLVQGAIYTRPDGSYQKGYLDVFRDTFRSELVFVEWEDCVRDPQLPTFGQCYTHYTSQGSPGYWTEDNSPKFSNSRE